MSQSYADRDIKFMINDHDANGSRRVTAELYDNDVCLACFVMSYIRNTVRVYPPNVKYLYTRGFYHEGSLDDPIHGDDVEWIGWVSNGRLVQSIICDMLYTSKATDPIEPLRIIVGNICKRLTQSA